MTRREHERRVLVHARYLQHCRGNRPALVQGRHTARRGLADPAAELPIHQLPGVQRERDRRTARRARRALAQLRGQTLDLADQQEHGLARLARHTDRAVPGDDALGLGLGAGAGASLGVKIGSPRTVHRLCGALTLCDLGERMLRVFGESQPVRAVPQQPADDALGELVERDQRSADRRQAVGVGVLEQRPHELLLDIRRKAQPPVLVGPRQVQHALSVTAPGATARDRPGERVAHLRAARQARHQPRQRLRPLGVERYAPRPLAGIPAPPGDCTQEQAQTIVIGKPQHGFAAVEGGKKGGGHEQNTIGARVDEALSRARARARPYQTPTCTMTNRHRSQPEPPRPRHILPTAPPRRCPGRPRTHLRCSGTRAVSRA